MAKNPEWQKAENERLSAEKTYSTFIKSQEALNMREESPEDYAAKIHELNAKIEAANKKVRTTRQEV